MNFSQSTVSLAALIALAATSAPADARATALRAYDYCAGSPLTIGAPFDGKGRVADIHVIADTNDAPVGWIYRSDRGTSYVQANANMSDDDQSALRLAAHHAVSNLRVRPASLPPDVKIRACRSSEIARY